MILMNQPVPADEAERIGLISQVVDDADLLMQGGKAAGKLAASSLPAYARSRQLLRASFETDLAQQLDLERTSMAEAAATPECAEGITAFLERRKANFWPDSRKAK